MFRVSHLALGPHLGRDIFNQKQVNSIVRRVGALSHQEGLMGLKTCSGEGKAGPRGTGTP